MAPVPPSGGELAAPEAPSLFLGMGIERATYCDTEALASAAVPIRLAAPGCSPSRFGVFSLESRFGDGGMPMFGFFNFFNPPRGRVSGGEWMRGRDYKKFSPAGTPLRGLRKLPERRTPTSSSAKDQVHDLVGAAIGTASDVVAPAAAIDLPGKAIPGRLAHLLGRSRRTAARRRG